MSDRFYLALALVTAASMGCGGGGDTAGSGGATGSSGHSTTTSSSGTTTSSSSGMGGGSGCAPGQGTVLAINKLYFGDGPNGEWKSLGINIDGLVSTAASKDVCKPNAGGNAATAYPDGDMGIDNSFGKNILPTLLIADPTFTTDSNASIQTGNFTMMMKLECLPPMGDVDPLTTKLFGGAPLGSAPKFDGTDAWPVAPELLTDPKDLDSSKIVFAKSTVKGQSYDSQKGQTFILTVPLNSPTGSTTITLTVHAAQVTLTLAADRKSATGGILGGVLNTEEFITEVKKVGYLNNLCNSPIFTNIENQMRQASDIMDDGTQDPAKMCNGISIGLGFDMKEVQIGTLGPMTPPGKACP